jgi:hypothetical protein
MAKEKTFKANAKDFIKYCGEYLKPGDKFQVKESDVEELKAYAEIEIPKETTTPPDNSGEGQGGQEPGGNGGQ